MKEKRKNSASRLKNNLPLLVVVAVAGFFTVGLPFYAMLNPRPAPVLVHEADVPQALADGSYAVDALPDLPLPEPVTSPDGSWLAVVEEDGEGGMRVGLLHTRDEALDREIFYASEARITALAFHPTGAWLAVGTTSDVQLININAPEQRFYDVNAGERVRSIAFSSDGDLMAIATQATASEGYLTLIKLPDEEADEGILLMVDMQTRFAVPSLATIAFVDEGLIGGLGDDGMIYRWDTMGNLG